jgi:hypothetical protein
MDTVLATFTKYMNFIRILLGSTVLTEVPFKHQLMPCVVPPGIIAGSTFRDVMWELHA